jgi:hypothetical protein
LGRGLLEGHSILRPGLSAGADQHRARARKAAWPSTSRKLVAKGALSPDDVRAILFDAAKDLDLAGGELTPEAARIVVEEDLAPAFLSGAT